jgi:hypothetical protein
MDRLVIYYADSIEGNFLPHPVNALSLAGRNAGLVFYSGDQLIRPTMDCRKRYGHSILLKEIVLLTPEHFIEREIAHIYPTWAPGLNGTHGYCQNQDLVVYDGRRSVRPHGL